MRSPHSPARISKAHRGERMSPFSKLAGLRCPNCDTLQSIRKLGATNPARGWNKTEAHECAGCHCLLYLTGESRSKRSLLFNAPVFLLSGAIGAEIVTYLEGLSYFHQARGRYEPNFLGFLFVCVLFVIPCQIALCRFEKIANFTGSHDGR